MSILEDFFDFIDHQNEDERIDHCGWYCCAVGDFIEASTGNRYTPGDESPDMDELLDALEAEEGFIYETLNQAGVSFGLEDEYDISTYGGLAAYIHDHRGLHIDDYCEYEAA